jgi:hypothetical protein
MSSANKIKIKHTLENEMFIKYKYSVNNILAILIIEVDLIKYYNKKK